VARHQHNGRNLGGGPQNVSQTFQSNPNFSPFFKCHISSRNPHLRDTTLTLPWWWNKKRKSRDRISVFQSHSSIPFGDQQRIRCEKINSEFKLRPIINPMIHIFKLNYFGLDRVERWSGEGLSIITTHILRPTAPVSLLPRLLSHTESTFSKKHAYTVIPSTYFGWNHCCQNKNLRYNPG